MPVAGIRTIAAARNGLSHFTPPLTTLHINYAPPPSPNRPNSSTPLTSFLTSPLLPLLTSKYPSTEFRVSPIANKHPVLKAHFIGGRIKAVCVKNLPPGEIKKRLEGLLNNSSGAKLRKLGSRKVVSERAEGVRGSWSALHGALKRV